MKQEKEIKEIELKTKPSIKASMTLKKRKIQNFYIPENHYKKIKKATYDKPYMWKSGYIYMKGYVNNEKETIISIFLVEQTFKEIKDKKV